MLLGAVEVGWWGGGGGRIGLRGRGLRVELGW